MNVIELRKQVNAARTNLEIKKNKVEILTKRKEDLERKIDELELDKLEQVSLILQKLSEKQREIAKMRLEELGTQALQYSLGSNYRMVIELSESRKRPQAFLFVIDEDKGIKTSPLDDNGGGIIDIISIALRLVVLQAHEPAIDGPIILDEPFKMVSKEYIPMLSDFLKKISNDFGRQIIMVTHNEFLAESCETRINIE